MMINQPTVASTFLQVMSLFLIINFIINYLIINYFFKDPYCVHEYQSRYRSNSQERGQF